MRPSIPGGKKGLGTPGAAGGLCVLLVLLPGCGPALRRSPEQPPAVQAYALCAEVVTSRGTMTLPVDLSPNYAIHVAVPAVIRFRACAEPRRRLKEWTQFRGHGGSGVSERRSGMSTMQAVLNLTAPRAAKRRLPPLWWAFEELKPERVEEALKILLSRREVENLLPLLPGWRLVADGRALERSRELASNEVAALYGTFVTSFADRLGISAAVNVTGSQAAVVLYSRRSKGRLGALSEGLLGFARLLG